MPDPEEDAMSRPWRLATSLETLRDEVLARHPGTTVWSIGDAKHRSRPSDHNPTASGVVCAIDVKGDKGLDLAGFAEHLKAGNHRAIKYVIFNRRIWSKARASEGWRSYSGDNPHLDHVHVSVGVGPDGRSTGPYDITTPWGIADLDGKPAAPKPSPAPSTRPAPGPKRSFPLPSGYYFGPKSGGNRSVSGFHNRRFGGVTDREHLKRFTRQLEARGWSARKGGRYLTRYGHDGRYGPEVAALTRAFQADQGLAVDGLPGPATWRAAFENPVT